MESLRQKVIMRTSWIGIGTNLLLSIMKVVLGILSNSVAILMDAVNNISDAASSLITIIGTWLAAKKQDQKHPFGYGRIEYFSTLLIAMLIFYAGVTSLKKSIEALLVPPVPDYQNITLFFLAIGVFVKFLLGSYFRKVGKDVHSDSLWNSGTEALFDAVVSISTLIAALIYLLTKISIEAWLGLLISVWIIKSGFFMLKEIISKLLGERINVKLAQDILECIEKEEGVYGAYDLVLNDYGPDTYTGSVHVEVLDTWNADQIDQLLRKLQKKVYQQCHVFLTVIGIYARNTTRKKDRILQNRIQEIVMSHPYVLEVHDFYIEQRIRQIRFDTVISFESHDRQKEVETIQKELEDKYPDYDFYITLDTDFGQGSR